MASTPPSTDNKVPVIWLAPPATLSPSTDPIAIHPLPLAINTTPDASPSTTHNVQAQRYGEGNAAKISVDTAATDDSSGTSASQDTTPVQDYHSYLKDSMHVPSVRKAADTRSPPSLSNMAPSYDAVLETWSDGVKDVETKAPDADVV